MTEEPLVYTSKGNLPLASLKFSDSWEFDPGGITYVSQYALDGEVVQRSAARYQLPQGLNINVQQGALNG
jgi:hypothetical protein